MFVKNFDGLKLYQFYNLSKYSTLSHYVSGRSVDDSGKSFNLSFKVGDKRTSLENRLALSKVFKISPYDLIFPDQTHSVNVKVIAGHNNQILDDTDALVTNVPGVCINVMSADCVPILLFDTRKNVVAAIHSGWRGTVGKIATKTLQTMKENFGTNPADIVAGIGPSICVDIYEVGAEVVDAVKAAFPNFFERIVEHQNNRDYLNLWQANFLQLVDAGVPESSIEISEICTFKNVGDFFSARKEGLSTGRFAAGIVLNNIV